MIEILNLFIYFITFGHCGSACVIGWHVWHKNLNSQIRCIVCGAHFEEPKPKVSYIDQFKNYLNSFKEKKKKKKK